MNANSILNSVVVSSLLLTGSSLAKEITQTKWAVIMDSPTPHMVGVDNSFSAGACKSINGQKIYIVASAASMPATDAYYINLSEKGIIKLQNAPNCKN